MAPEVPVTVTVDVPSVAVEVAVNVSVEVTVPFAGGVTGLGENAAVTPLGNPEAVSVVDELKPPWLVTVMVLGRFHSERRDRVRRGAHGETGRAGPDSEYQVVVIVIGAGTQETRYPGSGSWREPLAGSHRWAECRLSTALARPPQLA